MATYFYRFRFDWFTASYTIWRGGHRKISDRKISCCIIVVEWPSVDLRNPKEPCDPTDHVRLRARKTLDCANLRSVQGIHYLWLKLTLWKLPVSQSTWRLLLCHILSWNEQGNCCDSTVVLECIVSDPNSGSIVDTDKDACMGVMNVSVWLEWLRFAFRDSGLDSSTVYFKISNQRYRRIGFALTFWWCPHVLDSQQGVALDGKPG